MSDYVGNLFEALRMADEFQRLVFLRIGCKPSDLQCPREQSAMTPCIARDGHNAVAAALGGAVCVGCEQSVSELLEKEKAR